VSASAGALLSPLPPSRLRSELSIGRDGSRGLDGL